MSTVKSRLEYLELEQSILEDELIDLEEQGIYGGADYDRILETMRENDHDLDQLRLLDEDDMC